MTWTEPLTGGISKEMSEKVTHGTPWKDLSDTERIERIRYKIHKMESDFDLMKKKMDILEEHGHSENHIVVPANFHDPMLSVPASHNLNSMIQEKENVQVWF